MYPNEQSVLQHVSYLWPSSCAAIWIDIALYISSFTNEAYVLQTRDK